MKLEKLQGKRRLFLLKIFNDASPDTWFKQDVVAVIRNCSLATIERDRWAGTGVPFIKCGRSVRYRKRDILEWLESQKAVKSTTEAQLKAPK